MVRVGNSISIGFRLGKLCQCSSEGEGVSRGDREGRKQYKSCGKVVSAVLIEGEGCRVSALCRSLGGVSVQGMGRKVSHREVRDMKGVSEQR